MNIIELDLLDGRGLIEAAVAGPVERVRLHEFMRHATVKITEQARRAECYDDLLAAVNKLVEWDDAEKDGRPYGDGKHWEMKQRLCGEAFDMARAAIAKSTGAPV